MPFSNAIRKTMREATRKLMSGGADAATKAIQLALRDLPGGWAPEQAKPLQRAPSGTVRQVPPSAELPGQFLNKTLTNHAGTRAYKVYIPSSYRGQALPVVVMLHGCGQNPDDFANGTRMNALAEEKHCVVVYPAQSQAANPSRCWNWFKAVDQQRERGEPALIAGITREVIGHYQLDQNRVYVAGLSSGGAMAVIMATTYPDLYAAVGVHSGLPYGAANDLPSALAAMRGSLPGNRRQLPARHAVQSESTPIIIFHGDNDSTVNASNGEQMMQQNADQSLPGGLHDTSRIPPHVIVQQGQVPNGYRYTCTSRHQGDEKILAEHWIVHGGGHAWFGGSSSGSYTDPNGPDASREMLRFFYGQSPPAPG